MDEKSFQWNGKFLLAEFLYRLESQIDETEFDLLLSRKIDLLQAERDNLEAMRCPCCRQWRGL